MFGEEIWVVVETDKTQYSTGESLIVTGYILERKMPVVAMSVYDPDGIILSANSIELQEDNSFSKTISLDSPFYDKAGVYLIDFDYGKNTDQITFEIISSQIDQMPPIPDIIPEVIFLTTDKEVYQDNELIIITGMVSAVSDPTILIGVYEQSGMPTGFYTPLINSDLEFNVSFLAKHGINFKTFGDYIIKAHYADSKYETSFAFIDNSITNDVALPEQIEEEPIVDSSPKPSSTDIVDVPQSPIVKSTDDHSETKIVEEKPIIQTESIEPKQEEKEMTNNDFDNLTVEDVELGKILNEVRLGCDKSEYLDVLAYYDGMGPALMRLCNYNQAISYFDQSLIEEPNNVEIITNKGSALAKIGNIDAAIANYDLALEIDADYLPALNNKANVLVEQGKTDEAIEIYNFILKKDPSYTTTQSNLQKIQEKLAKRLLSEQKSNSMEISDTTIEVNEVDIEEAISDTTQPEPAALSILEKIGSVFVGIFGFLK